MPVSQFPDELELLARGFAVADSIHRLLLQWAQRDADGFAAYVVGHGSCLPIDLSTSEYSIAGELLDVLIPRDPAKAIAVLKVCPDFDNDTLWEYVDSWRRKFPDTFPQAVAALGQRLADRSPGPGMVGAPRLDQPALAPEAPSNTSLIPAAPLGRR